MASTTCLRNSELIAKEFEDVKRPLEHTDYDAWRTIGGRSISGNGKWVMYSINHRVDGNVLVIRSATSNKEYTIKHASMGTFSEDSGFAVYSIQPDPKLLKQLRKEKKTDLPTANVQVLELETGSHFLIERTSTFTLPKKNSVWLAVLLLAPTESETVKSQKSELSENLEVTETGLQLPQVPWNWVPMSSAKPKPAEGTSGTTAKVGEKQTPAEQAKPKEEESQKAKEKRKGTVLVLRNLNTHVEQRFPNVTSYVFSEKGEVLVFATSGEKPEDDGVTAVDLRTGATRSLISGRGNYTNLAINLNGSQVAFVSDRDDFEKEFSSHSLYHGTPKTDAKRIAFEGDKGIPEGWWVAAEGNISFSEDNRRLLFATRPKPEAATTDKSSEAKQDAADDEEKAVLDIWHWQDPLLQPQQLVEKSAEERRSYLAIYDLRSKKIVQIATPEVPQVFVDVRSKSDFAIANSLERYKKELSWDIPGYRDVYRVDLRNGKSEIIHERSQFSAQLSPHGRFAYWFDGNEKHWYALELSTGQTHAISTGIPYPLHDELHDTPNLPNAYGAAGWLHGEKGLLVYDRYDVWLLDPTGSVPPINVTNGYGRSQLIRLRYLRLDPEQREIDLNQRVYLAAFQEVRNASGFYSLEYKADPAETALKRLMLLDERINLVAKAEGSDDVILTRETFRRFPDLWHGTLQMNKLTRLSRVNPQQSEFTWGTAEMVSWQSRTGESLNGLLYKPDDFDPNRKYPMIVYFYERNSDNLHQFHIPAPGRSIISFSFYVSRGYLVFVPDIPYRTGEPGPSAVDAILPGVDHLIAQGYVDENKLGLQGHSWGGYQIAYLVTQTNRFACAEAGAPVSNMTSAYGGIRWGSGMSRMFQYERTQSRIGQTMWEARDKYLANSPIFFADQIETPLLILHNDQDDAVPWYQGIELFVALRRLSKPAWMLNYNGDPHWVMSYANRLDFATRMQQFFDHYLKDAPMPVWMAEGIPAVNKGKKFGFEYVPPK
ncbi:MAG TPA: prolyl oligopeptidase family serine peptidase [Pirellulaceae bacterium]|nr:prolyl oligopeptidase family serine peptidase [Pirellulaceae bacterium]HMO91122.1 prolyl oligopeptidase family serine peptidase [Pirellulaceae bacterium]HMP71062.1 prolyl oligopeptidase family serine peptidase [Pirellulaceae bacterium]